MDPVGRRDYFEHDFAPVAENECDLRLLARRQRWLLWLIGAALVMHAIPVGLWYLQVPTKIFPIQALQMILRLVAAIGIVAVMRANGDGVASQIACGLLMFIPCGDLIVLFAVNFFVTATLQRAGLPLGLLGVSAEAVERHLNSNLCRGCGYDLTGNVSGRCPECGVVVLDRPEAPGAA